MATMEVEFMESHDTRLLYIDKQFLEEKEQERKRMKVRGRVLHQGWPIVDTAPPFHGKDYKGM